MTPGRLLTCLLVGACVMLAVGCGREQPDRVEVSLEEGEALKQAEQTMAMLKREHEAALAAQASRHERAYQERSADTFADLERQLGEAQTALAVLEKQLAEKNQEIAALKRTAEPPPPPVPARVSVYRPPTPPTRSLPITGESKEAFPLKVYAVAGRSAVSGTHTSLRFVATDETYRDGLGRLQKVKKPERFEAKEYAFEVAFSVENLTDQPQTFSMRAGSLSRTAHVGPSETRTNLAITASIGAPLIITTGTHRRRFSVPPSTSAPTPAQ